MPVTANLSKPFYDRCGEDVVNELVEWFNAVNATCRADLRELNELNFARFDARLEQRIAELRAELSVRIDRVAARLNAKIDSTAALLNATLERRLGEQARWLFVAWASLVIPIMGLWLRP